MTYLPVDVIVDQKGKQKHIIDALNLLAYTVLLVLVLVTTWVLKRRKKLCIHETGLAIIYGMIMGAILRYGGIEVTIRSEILNDTIPETVPADYVIVEARNLADKNATQPHLYAYEFRGELQASAKLGSQISYASVDPEVFFNIILPPIVLNAGLSLKRRHFFRNIGAIFSYAFIGTSISVAFVGTFIYGSIQLFKSFLALPYLADQFSLANCFYFGAIISPTDPLAVLAIFQELGVDVNLFALVFGESILNDAVSIVLTHSIDQFSVVYSRNPYHPLLSLIWECIFNFITMFFNSCLIGILFGVVTALTTKFTKLNETPLLETSLVVLMSYSSFLTAEVLDASGIVAILLCGITQAHYTINNLSFEAREWIKNLFELLTFMCENFLFLAVGVAFWQRGQTWNLPFIGIAFLAVTIARAISVYPLTWLLNLGRRHKIACNFQHVIAWGGAARGVISYSLAARNTVGDARRIMLSTTSVIVIFSVIVVGGTVDLMLKFLRIPFQSASNNGLGGGTNDYSEFAAGANEQRRGGGGGGVGGGNELVVAQDQFGRPAITANDPSWLLRRTTTATIHTKHRLHRSTSDNSPLHLGPQTPTAAAHIITGNAQPSKRHHHHYHHPLSHHYNHSSAHTTPILEVDAVWINSEQRAFSTAAPTFDLDQSSVATSILPPVPELNCDLMRDENDDLSSLVRADHHQLSVDPHLPAAAAATNIKLASGTCYGGISTPPCRGNHQHHAPTPGAGSSAPVAPVLESPPAIGGTSANTHTTSWNNAYENASLVRRWRNLDNNFIKPLLTNSHPTLMETMPPSLRHLARWFTSDEQLLRQQLLSSTSEC